MALLTCTECGGKISSKAAACPHCGAPVTLPESVKSSCQSCGEHIEHPFEMLGQAIDCPHCGKATVLAGDPEEGVPQQAWEGAGAVTPSISVADQEGTGHEDVYYVWIDQQRTGPFTVGKLETLVQEGRIHAAILCAKAGTSQWQSLKTILVAGNRGNSPIVKSPPLVQTVPSASSAPNKQKKEDQNPVVLGCATLGAFVAVMLGIAAVSMLFRSPEENARMLAEDENHDAYYAAENFIKSQYPGAKSFGGYDKAVVQQNGNTFMVGITVDGLNAFGGPVRQDLIVEMELAGKNWRLVQIHKGGSAR